MLSSYLRMKYKKDKETIAVNGIKGFNLEKYYSIAEKIHGIQAGLITFIAQANVGKTALLTCFAMDLLLSNDGLRILFFTFDDTRSEIIDNFVAQMSGLSKNKINCNWDRTEQQDGLILKNFKTLESYSQKDLLELKTFEDVSTLDAFEECLRENKAKYRKLAVFIDGVALMETKFDNDDVKAEGLKSKRLKQLCNELNVPILISLETRKGEFHRPNKNSGKGSGRYAYDSRLVLCLSEVDEQYKEQRCHPDILIDCDKSKFGNKFKEFATMKGHLADIVLLKDEERIKCKERMRIYDKERLRRNN